MSVSSPIHSYLLALAVEGLQAFLPSGPAASHARKQPLVFLAGVLFRVILLELTFANVDLAALIV